MIPALALWLAAAPPDVVKEIEVRASPGDVWKAWTTAEGARGFFAPDAKIEPKAGGAYELYFDPSQPAGKRGSEGCTVIAAEPLRKLAFTWNFPPAIPSLRDSKAHTTVTVELLPQGKTVKVRLTQTGWKDEPAWHDGRKYFDGAWGVVLARLAHRFRRGSPIDWKNAWSPAMAYDFEFLQGTWVSVDGAEIESWVSSAGSLLGTSRELENAKPVFYELAALEPDDGEWTMSIRMFKVGLSDHPKTEHEAARLVLDSLGKDRAVFVTEFGDPVSVEYARSGDALDVTVKRAKGEEKHHFKLRDAGH